MSADLNEIELQQYMYIYLKLLGTIAHNQKCNLPQKDTCIPALLVLDIASREGGTDLGYWACNAQHYASLENTETHNRDIILNTPDSVFLQASRSDSRIAIKALLLQQVWRPRACTNLSSKANLFLPLIPFLYLPLWFEYCINHHFLRNTHVLCHRCPLFRWAF